MQHEALDQPMRQPHALPIHEQYPAVAKSVRLVRWRCRSVAEAVGATREQAEDIALATTEAASNVVLHAYPPDAGGQLHLRISSPGPQWLEVVLTDTGVGVGNATSPGGLGKGLLIMAHLAEAIDVARRSVGGTVVTMSFRVG